MFSAISPSESDVSLSERVGGVRVSGGVAVRVNAVDGRSRIQDLRERDGYKVRFPRRSDPLEAIVINTGGGLASGDRIEQRFDVGEDATLAVTTQASERSYRSVGSLTTDLKVRAQVGRNARLNWLPQETILFNESRLSRSIEVDLAASSQALIAETVVFGRIAMGETLSGGFFADRWRIRQNDRLLFAENVRLDDEAFQGMAKAAMSGGAHVATTLVYVAPDAEGLLNVARKTIMDAPFQCAVSAWNGMLVVRGLAHRSEDVRRMVARLVPALGAGPLPRVWWT